MCIKKGRFSYVLVFLFSSNYAFAAGGLSAGTNALTEIKFWLFTIIGVGALCYLCYNIGMAFMERKSWGDVGMAGLYCSIAGGALVGGNWMLNIFQ